MNILEIFRKRENQMVFYGETIKQVTKKANRWLIANGVMGKVSFWSFGTYNNDGVQKQKLIVVFPMTPLQLEWRAMRKK